MFARSATFHAVPGNIDAGIAFVNNEVAPILAGIEGCRGLSLVVDRDTAMCIATSSWESEEAMRSSDDTMRPVRERGGVRHPRWIL